MTTSTKTFAGSRHTGYVVTNENGVTVATVTESRLRTDRGGYHVRLYTSPDTYSVRRVTGLLDAREIAERHARVFEDWYA